MAPDVLLASFEGMTATVTDDPSLLAGLRERGVDAQAWAWTDPMAPWDDAGLVWVRTTWDYTRQPQRWRRWLGERSRSGVRVENQPALLAWSSDKRYLADLATAGVPTVPTTFVAPGAPLPPLEGEVVVKPSESAGGRDTGRFGPGRHAEAAALVARIASSGRTAMVQPFVPSVDERGETAVVVVDGIVSHVLRKRAVLRPDEVAPVRDDPLGAAEAMYDPDLVQADPDGASADELALVDRLLSYLQERFDTTPLQMRVDLLAGAHGGPVLLELEAVEPNLYLDQVGPSATVGLLDAVLRRLQR
jgi:hypothetical protein